LAPIVTNTAFAIEIFIKCLLESKGIAVPEHHDLFKLFKLLPAEERKAILEETQRVSGVQSSQMIATLSRNADLFVRWRYVHETLPTALDLQPLAAFANGLKRRIDTSNPSWVSVPDDLQFALVGEIQRDPNNPDVIFLRSDVP
jgi:hypothetical protein